MLVTLRIFFAIAIILNSNLFADGWDPSLSLDKDVTLVSLGSHCEIAMHLNENHLRKAAFPFDWLLTCNHDLFHKLLDDDFAFFLDEKYLIQHPNHPYVIENCRYEIEFRHDGPFLDLQCDPIRYRVQLQEMDLKYERRINRFRELRSYQGKVFFIRAAYDLQNDPNLYWGIEDIEQITTEQALEIKKTLDRYFPNLNFTLVILNYLQSNAPPIQPIDNVLEFKINKYKKHEDYTRLFNFLIYERL